MVRASLDECVIVQVIDSSDPRFELSTDALAVLRQDGISDPGSDGDDGAVAAARVFT